MKHVRWWLVIVIVYLVVGSMICVKLAVDVACISADIDRTLERNKQLLLDIKNGLQELERIEKAGITIWAVRIVSTLV